MVDYTTAHPDGSGEVLIEEIRRLDAKIDALDDGLVLALRNILERLDAVERRIDWSKPELWN